MVKLLADSRAALRLEIKEKMEAGVVLSGAEVKACRQGRIDLSKAFVRVISGEAFVLGMRLSSSYQGGIKAKAEEGRTRKLLLKRGEIGRLSGLLSQKGFVAVPSQLYLKGNLVKVAVGVGPLRRRWEKKRSRSSRSNLREAEFN